MKALASARLMVVCLALAFLSTALVGPLPGADPESLDAAFARLQREHKAAIEAIMKEGEGGRPDRDRRVARAEEPLGRRSLELVRTAPASTNAAGICLWLLREMRSSAAAAEAAEVLARHHLADPRTLATVRSMTGSPEVWTEPLLRRLCAAPLAPPAARGRARWALADCLNTLADRTLEAKTNAVRAAALQAESLALYEEVARDYGDEPHGDSTLGDYARRALRRHRDLAIGRPAPATAGTDTEGQKFRLEDYRGRVVLLVFCGHWCGPCRQMYEHERTIHARFKDRPFALIGINSDTDLKAFRQVRSREKLDWRWFWDEGTAGPIDQLWGIEMWPTTVLLDQHGIIRGRYLYHESLDRQLEELVTAAEAEAGAKAERGRKTGGPRELNR
jgi:peroxiredoxin